jgi:hypothetical protein
VHRSTHAEEGIGMALVGRAIGTLSLHPAEPPQRINAFVAA